MASSSLEPPAPLRGKLSQVEFLLEDASRKLQEEASKYEIFATRTSANSGNSTNLAAPTQHQSNGAAPRDVHDLISDISMLKSVLSCPIFNRIVNVTDSLDQLSYQLNLHPSIGPSDINIDTNGELILAAPIEPASLNNLINKRLDEFSEQSASNLSPHIIRTPEFNNNHNGSIGANNESILTDQQRSHDRISSIVDANFSNPLDGISNDGYVQSTSIVQANQNTKLTKQQHYNCGINNSSLKKVQSTNGGGDGVRVFANASSALKSVDSFETEKLVSNGASKVAKNTNAGIDNARYEVNSVFNGNSRQESVSNQSNLSYRAVNGDSTNTRLINSGNTLGREPESNDVDMSDDVPSHNHPSLDGPKCFSNEAYRTAYELSQSENIDAPERRQQQVLSDSQNHSLIIKNAHCQSPAVAGANLQYNKGSCSPSISVGSTVRLADECDSGASSFLSQAAKGSFYQPNQTTNKTSERSKDSAVASPSEERTNSAEQDLMDNLYPDMERIKVTLEKEDGSLGITVGGYTCEDDEISGMFIRCITPGSAADKGGKIKTLDQIYSVNGRVILGYSNQEALYILKHTGKVVTLELMRYLAASKYKQLQNALGQASHQPETQKASTNAGASLNHEKNARSSNIVASSKESKAPASRLRETNDSPTKSSLIPRAEGMTLHNPSGQQQQASGLKKTNPDQENASSLSPTKVFQGHRAITTGVSSSYGNSNQSNEPYSQSQIPVAAQRSGASKVIETKHGARNTVDIKSPVFQTAKATFAKTNLYDTERNTTSTQLKRESSDEFGLLIPTGEPEWEKIPQIIELYKDPSQGLGFTVKEYANPMDRHQSIIMVTSLSPGYVAEQDGRLAVGDLLISVDGTSLEGASLAETVKALKNTYGQVRLGVLKFKRS